MNKIAIVVIAYKRENSLRNLLESLDKAYYNELDIPLIISIDKSENKNVEIFANSFVWRYGEKQIIIHSEKLGLRNHVLECGKLLDLYDAIIVLEDDILISENFYFYSKATVNKYINNNEVAGISLYSFHINYQTLMPFSPVKDENDVFFMNCSQSWGQIWLKNQWNEFKDWYLKNTIEFGELDYLPKTLCNWPKSSWLKYHTRYCIEKNKYFVYPYTSLSTNNGDIGTHNTDKNFLFQVVLQRGVKSNYKLPDSSLDAVCYDGFFENKKINEIIKSLIDINNDQICIDLNGEKKNRENKRYWLTTKSEKYKIILQFDLNFKPIEENVLYNCNGEEIFLYDTHMYSTSPNKNKYKIIKYFFEIEDIIGILYKYGLSNLFFDLIYKIKRKYFHVK